MKRLFVDDQRQVPEGWEVARCVTNAILAIDAIDFDEISLDHDILHTKVACPEVFVGVAMFIKEKYRGVEKKPRIIIHTSNPAGALRMTSILSDFVVIRKELPPSSYDVQ